MHRAEPEARARLANGVEAPCPSLPPADGRLRLGGWAACSTTHSFRDWG